MNSNLEKIIDAPQIFLFQEGMRGSYLFHKLEVRFCWRDDRWWHVIAGVNRGSPQWLRIAHTSISSWAPDLEDAATAGIILSRASILLDSAARFVGDSLVTEDGRSWQGKSKTESIRMALDIL